MKKRQGPSGPKEKRRRDQSKAIQGTKHLFFIGFFHRFNTWRLESPTLKASLRPTWESSFQRPLHDSTASTELFCVLLEELFDTLGLLISAPEADEAYGKAVDVLRGMWKCVTVKGSLKIQMRRAIPQREALSATYVTTRFSVTAHTKPYGKGHVSNTTRKATAFPVTTKAFPIHGAFSRGSLSQRAPVIPRSCHLELSRSSERQLASGRPAHPTCSTLLVLS